MIGWREGESEREMVSMWTCLAIFINFRCKVSHLPLWSERKREKSLFTECCLRVTAVLVSILPTIIIGACILMRWWIHFFVPCLLCLWRIQSRRKENEKERSACNHRCKRVKCRVKCLYLGASDSFLRWKVNRNKEERIIIYFNWKQFARMCIQNFYIDQWCVVRWIVVGKYWGKSKLKDPAKVVSRFWVAQRNRRQTERGRQDKLNFVSCRKEGYYIISHTECP